ncbi:hypothetical protein IEO21_03642 [Rhodonia placenta]|uniref:F-box domain-containing protein n=1 Tax=Rhodonia placenta TaxID=104341 RepID=A0A8H7P592_9APHY|nr:hypothetical protein IEO21_03642 [Postia placenta]
MSLLEHLPVELFLSILRFVPLQYLYSLRRTSRTINNIIAANESYVYHHAALLHQYVNSVDIGLSEIPRTGTAYPARDTSTWKSFCELKRMYISFGLVAEILESGAQCLSLDKNWLGKGELSTRSYCTNDRDVHRIKVDEDRGLLITSYVDGGIRVTDTKTDERLWALSMSYVRPNAHVEYEKGFLIFDRIGHCKEVWRLSEDYIATDLPHNVAPDDSQEAAWREAEQRFHSTSRGHFRPWALLTPPEMTRAFRFSYPTLVVMSHMNAFLWDIPTGSLAQTLHNVQDLHGGVLPLGDVMYVDVSPQHVFVCGLVELRLFNRSDGAVALRIPAGRQVFADTRIALTIPDVLRCYPSWAVGSHPPPPHAFMAAHVSRDGQDLVALISDNRLLFLKDFERVVRGQISLAEATLEVELISSTLNSGGIADWPVYLAFEHGRVSAVTTSGVYVFVLDAAEHTRCDSDILPQGPTVSLERIQFKHEIPQHASFPNLAVAHVPQLKGQETLSEVRCLQMTATRLYLACDKQYLPKKGKERAEIALDVQRSYGQDEYIGPSNGPATSAATHATLPDAAFATWDTANTDEDLPGESTIFTGELGYSDEEEDWEDELDENGEDWEDHIEPYIVEDYDDGGMDMDMVEDVGESEFQRPSAIQRPD